MIRRVDYRPRSARAGSVEVTTVATLRARGGAEEFLAPQRLTFELLLVVASSSYRHEVDFTEVTTAPADVLWVHAGQAQQWGRIEDLEGTALLFPAASIPAEVARLLEERGAFERNLWPGAAAEGGLPAAGAAALLALGRGLAAAPDLDPVVGAAALEHAVGAFLLLLAGGVSVDGVQPPDGDVFRWFVAEVERGFTGERSVAAYARRIGYSARTLNRAAQLHAGVTAKELIDQRVVLEAKRMLAHEAVPAVEIAERLGFADAANFSAYFRHRTGMAPGAFRRSRGRPTG